MMKGGRGKAMNKTLLEIAAVFGLALIAAPAVADEAPPVQHVRHVERAPAAPARAAPVSTQPSWTGAQVGGQGGVSPMAQGFAEPGAHLYSLASYCNAPSPNGYPTWCQETPFSFSGNKTSATGGAFLGYRWQFGTAVVGIEGDANAKSGSNSYAYSDSNQFRSEMFYGTVSQSWDASVRGRAGFLVTPWTLAYGTVGVAFGGVGGSFSYAANQIDTDIDPCIGHCAAVAGGGSWSTTRSGLTGGAGLEALITQALTLRLEYRYTDLGRFSEDVYLRTGNCLNNCSSPSSNALINLHPTFQAVRLGLGYNF
jgi:outer membrane immunogenic protein